MILWILTLLWLARTVLSTDTGRTPECTTFAKSLSLRNFNSTVLSSEFIQAGGTVQIGGGQGKYCINSTTAAVDICRITFNISLSARTSALAEIWLPTGQKKDWSRRMMNTGSPGLSGCIDYENVAYATSLGFAAVGDNGGHDGGLEDGSSFFSNKDAIIDFSYRSRHASVQLGKEVCKQFYGHKVKKAYHFGCSNVGRQAHKAAQMYPDDFDGILSGAPGLDWNHLTSWGGHFLTLTGADASDPRFLTTEQWSLVHDEVLRQCDGLDGVSDGILEDSSICAFNPEVLLCQQNSPPLSANPPPVHCLTLRQAQTVRAIFSPLYGLNDTYIYPRLSPGAEYQADTSPLFPYLNGNKNNLGYVWYSNGVFNNLSFDPTTLNALDYSYADQLDAQNGHISSFDSDLSRFRNRGGKIINYHGGTDAIVPDDISRRYYRLLSKTMNLSAAKLDEFYRFFPISGMEHCLLGPGAWAFGQESLAAKSTFNAVMALVDWVENNNPPDRIVGTKWVDDFDPAKGVAFQRAHCRYPFRTTYLGGGRDPKSVDSWTCNPIEDWDRCGGPNGRLPLLC